MLFRNTGNSCRVYVHINKPGVDGMICYLVFQGCATEEANSCIDIILPFADWTKHFGHTILLLIYYGKFAG
jgi:hypothetical protein